MPRHFSTFASRLQEPLGCFAVATQQIQRSLAPAISTLQSIAEDENAGLNARVSAAKGLLEYGIRLAELNDIYRRIEELEGRL